MNTDTEIRPIDPADAEAVYVLLQNMNVEMGAEPIAAPVARLGAHFQTGRFWGFAATAKRVLIGHVFGEDFTSSATLEGGAHINSLYVAPDFRRLGIARRLVFAFAAETRRKGGTQVWWLASNDNSAAHALYREIGAGEGMPSLHVLTGDAFTAAAARGADDLDDGSPMS